MISNKILNKNFSPSTIMKMSFLNNIFSLSALHSEKWPHEENVWNTSMIQADLIICFKLKLLLSHYAMFFSCTYLQVSACQKFLKISIHILSDQNVVFFCFFFVTYKVIKLRFTIRAVFVLIVRLFMAFLLDILINMLLIIFFFL